MIPLGMRHPPLLSLTRASTMSEVHASSGAKRPVPVIKARTPGLCSLCVIRGPRRRVPPSRRRLFPLCHQLNRGHWAPVARCEPTPGESLTPTHGVGADRIRQTLQIDLAAVVEAERLARAELPDADRHGDVAR